ncbi:PaaI family thioesterase [Actinokineospora enzanensis]|uniref:PaaI family thioesterase n=1 Tax=Actinokineospora enzanensis TaxID=155975 RepID=UPI000360D274|nr:PaaI family thioesterase [Actinokineospora enzanensis]
MTLHRLDQRATMLETDCFVCSASNEHGLRIPFTYDDEAELVTAEMTFGIEHSGAPTYVHGGLSLAVLNESMAWAVVATTRGFAITIAMNSEFHRPLRIGTTYRVEARVTGSEPNLRHAEATLRNPSEDPCVTTTATFRTLSDNVSNRLRARVARNQSPAAT